MPTVKIDKKDLLDLIGKKIPDDELGFKLSMLGTDVSNISKDIEVEIFPNRPDLLSQEGLARALKNFTQKNPKINNYRAYDSSYEASIDPKVKKLRGCVSGCVVKGIKFNDASIKSLMQLQEKLHLTFGRNRKKVSIGVYDLDTISFPLRYTTKDENFQFIPLERKNKMSIKEILDKHPKGKEYAHLVRKFDEFPIWLDANNEVLAIPPIINSDHTKVHEKSRNLYIDCTGLDQEAVEKAVNIISTGLIDRGAKVYQVKINNEKHPKLENSKIEVNTNYINNLLGLNLKNNEIKKCLNKMGLDLSGNNVIIPSYRTDILHPIDVVEDIAIGYGYENFIEEIPNISSIGEEDKVHEFIKKISNILTNSGLIEVNTYHLINKDFQTKKMLLNNEVVEIENPVNMEYNSLRNSMIPSLLEVLKNNKSNEYPQDIFEVSTIFKLKEDFSLGVCLCKDKITFTNVKQILDILFRNLGLEYKIKDYNHKSFIKGRVGKISCKNKELGFLGELNPLVLGNFELENPVVALEINISELFKLI